MTGRETDCETAVSNLRHNRELLLWMHTPLTLDVVLVVRREGSSKDLYIIVSKGASPWAVGASKRVFRLKRRASEVVQSYLSSKRDLRGKRSCKIDRELPGSRGLPGK